MEAEGKERGRPGSPCEGGAEKMLCALVGAPALPPLPGLGHPTDCRDKGRKEVASARAGDSGDVHLNKEKVYLLFLAGDAK